MSERVGLRNIGPYLRQEVLPVGGLLVGASAWMFEGTVWKATRIREQSQKY